MKRLALGSDHAGFPLKDFLHKELEAQGYHITDFGCFSEERADYPDFAHLVANAITNNEADFGILVCGSGNGINITANKHKGIRSALAWNPEIAEMAVKHNKANILALPGRYIDKQTGLACVKAFLTAEFEGGRHADRIAKIEVN